MITERHLRTDRLTMRIREAGEGPLVLCVHGYPDTAHTWDDLLPALAGAGFHAVAPWTRGYPPTDLAPDGDYSVPALGRDLIALADALGAERFSLVGHDWGAGACYMAAGLAPERIDRLIAIAIPPARAVAPSLRVLWAIRHFFWYALPWLPERELPANGYAAVRAICRRWSPSWTIPDDELAHIVASFEAPGGLQGALGYYRAFMRGIFGAAARESLQVQRKRLTVPTQLIYGAEDIAAFMYATEMGDCFADGVPHQVVRIEGAGHFVQREKPLEVAEAVLRWLDE